MAAIAGAARRPQALTRARALPTAYIVCLGGLVVVAAVLRFAGLGSQSYWYDEAFTVHLMHKDPVHMLGLIPKTELTPPLYYVLAWGWAHVFGYGELALRSLSALLGIATVPVAYAAASALVSRRAGLITAAFVATSPFMVWYSQEARSYALLALAAAASLYFFARAREGFDKRALIGWAAASIVALGSHYCAVLLVVPEAVLLLRRAGARRGDVWRAVGAIAAAGLALLPLALHQRHNAGWIGDLKLGPRLAELPRVFAGGTSSPAVWLTVAIGTIWVAGIVLALAVGSSRERSGARLAAGLALSAVAIALVLKLAGNDIVLGRNLIALWLPLAVAAAAGLGARRAGRLGLAAAGVAAALSASIVLATLSNDRLQRADWHEAAQALGPATTPRLIAGAGGYRAEALRLALANARTPRLGERLQVSELDFVGFDPPSGYACWSGRACNVPRTGVPATSPVPGFHLVGRRKIGFFKIATFRASRPTTVQPIKLIGHPGADRPRVLLEPQQG